MAELTVKQLKEKHAGLVKEMRELNEKAKDEKRSFSSDDDAKWSKMNADLEACEREIKLASIEERKAADEAETAELDEQARKDEERGKTIDPETEHRQVFDKFLRHGMSALEPDERSILKKVDTKGVDTRALSTADNTTGGLGYIIPTQFAGKIETYMTLYGGMKEECDVIKTATGGTFEYPYENNTAQEGEYIAENTQHNELDPGVNITTFADYTLSSKIVRASLQSIHDSYFDVDTWLAERFGERMGRTENGSFTNGDGSGKPTGLLQSTSSGFTAASASTLIYDDFVGLEHSVDPVYRRGAIFMFNDTTFKLAKLIKDDQGRPIFMPGLADSGMSAVAPSTILGYRYKINQDMPAATTGLTPIAFGNFKKYVIREVNQMGMLRLTERYADYLQVGYLAFRRHDGKLNNSIAIKHLTMA